MYDGLFYSILLWKLRQSLLSIIPSTVDWPGVLCFVQLEVFSEIVLSDFTSIFVILSFMEMENELLKVLESDLGEYL